MSNRQEYRYLRPQAGFQAKFTESEADIVIGGGSAGCGKTFGLLFFPIAAMSIPNFVSYIFRREAKQINVGGGLWDASVELYNQLPQQNKPQMKSHNHRHVWANGASLTFDHINHKSDIYNYQGSEMAYVGFDELTHFDEEMFWYMVSRNRSTKYNNPFVRATTNPQGEGWIKRLISWWLYPSDYHIEELQDYPIPERDGVLRYYYRYDNDMVWGNTVDEVVRIIGCDSSDVRSITFIGGKLSENQILNERDPTYRAKLMSLSTNEREQLLLGRWRNAVDDETLIFDTAAVDDLPHNTFVKGATRYITVDVALEGVDPLVAFVWDGWRIIAVKKIDKTSGSAVIEAINELKTKYNVPNRQICYDADGVGGFVAGYIQGAIAFHGNGAVKEVNNVKESYVNLRSQCYYHAASKVNNSEAYYDENLPYYSELKKELLVIRKANKPDGKRGIETKDIIKARLGRSPNFADAFMMRSIFDFTKVTGSYSGMYVSTN